MRLMMRNNVCKKLSLPWVSLIYMITLVSYYCLVSRSDLGAEMIAFEFILS